ncbi:MAG: type II toxin-antitoxin system VapB family antitoxin [Verrucomicrobia bacterium]|nr:type II toxin-antitoxin system VapB family antitoxin [Verrucomicrobiota bacterium]
MRITVDIDQTILAAVMELTGEKKKSPAISKAVVEYVKRTRARDFGRLIMEKAFDYRTTNEEIERQDV